MIAFVRITVWAVAGALWGASLASSGSTLVSARPALIGAGAGLVAGALVGLAIHGLFQRIRRRRQRDDPDS